MTFAVGVVISFIIISSVIYVLPIISDKISLTFLLIMTTFVFIISSLMGKLYSPLIGIGIFLLLIGSLSILIGKNRVWLETTTNKNDLSSRRKRYKEIIVTEGSNLRNISSLDDRLLFQKYKGENKHVTKSPQSVLDLKLIQNQNDLGKLEVAASSDDNFYSDKSDVFSDDIREESTDNKIVRNDDIKRDISVISNDELSDQWMEKRLQSLFDNEKNNDNAQTENSLENINDLDNSRYEDLSEGYFKQSGSVNNGT